MRTPKTVKIMVEVETDGDTPQEVRDAVKTMLSESYYTATAVEIYTKEQAVRVAYNVLDDAFILHIRANNEPSYILNGTNFDDLSAKLVKALDPIESARELAKAKAILEDIK